MLPLLESPAAAALVVYRQDGSAHLSPVWFRWTGEVFEVVIAEGDRGVVLTLRPTNPRVWDLAELGTGV